MVTPQKIVPDKPQDQGVRVVRFEEATGGGGKISREGRYARTNEPKSEIRRCGRCGKDAVVCCQCWTHSMNGMSTGAVTRECRCQACGADVTLADPGAIRTLKIVAWILIIAAVIPTPIVLFMAWRKARVWDKNPLVPGAARPPITSWRGPGNRRCGACGGIARLIAVTRRSHNGMPMGTDCDYECASCKREFSTESLGGVIVTLLAAALFIGGGAFVLLQPKGKETWFVVLAGACALGALFMLRNTGKKVLAAIKNPKLSGPDAA